MNWSILLNPFTKFSEKQLLVFGLLSAVVGSLLATLFGVTFDGVIDVHMWPEMTFLQSLKENGVTLILMTLLLFGLGKLINSKSRFVDILNAALLFRVPFYLMAALVSIPAIKKIEEELMKNVQTMAGVGLKTTDIIVLLCLTSAIIALLIYAIALLYNGFKTATNVKKISHKIFFGLAILVAEILSKIILPLL